MEENKKDTDEKWIEVEAVCQYPALPTGCEVTATSMFLSWLLHLRDSVSEIAKSPSSSSSRPHLGTLWGRSLDHLDRKAIDRMTLADFIVKEPDPYVPPEGGRPRGGDPYRAFVGEPTSRASFGTFHEPIFRLLDDERYIKGLVIDLTPHIRTSLLTVSSSPFSPDEGGEGDDGEAERKKEEIGFGWLKECIDDGRPVIVWMTLELRPPHVTDEWDDYRDHLSEKEEEKTKKPKRVFRWTSPEHCALLVGYSPSAVFINDPHTGRRERYDRRLFLHRWLHMGAQAVTLRPF